MTNPGTPSRFADYFVVCGLDVKSGLEPDQLSGLFVSLCNRRLGVGELDPCQSMYGYYKTRFVICSCQLLLPEFNHCTRIIGPICTRVQQL